MRSGYSLASSIPIFAHIKKHLLTSHPAVCGKFQFFGVFDSFFVKHCHGVLRQRRSVSEDHLTPEGAAVYSRGRHLENIHTGC